jgi:hypothetical protein
MLNDGFDILHPIDSSKQIVKDWWAAVVKIRDTPIPDNNPDLVNRRNALLDRAYSLSAMVKTAIGEENAASFGLGNPLAIGIAGAVALSAIIAYIGKYMTDYFSYMKDMDAAAQAATYQKQVDNDQVAKGVPAAQAAAAAKDAATGLYQQNKTDKTFLGVPTKYWLIGGGVLALLVLMSARRGGSSPAPVIMMGPPK